MKKEGAKTNEKKTQKIKYLAAHGMKREKELQLLTSPQALQLTRAFAYQYWVTTKNYCCLIKRKSAKQKRNCQKLNMFKLPMS